MNKLLKFIFRKWYILLLIFLAIIAQCYLQLMLPDYMGKITSVITTQTFSNNGDLTTYILQTGGIMIAIAFGVFALAIVQNYSGSYLSSYVGKILRNEMFEKVNSLSLAEYNKFGTSTLITRTTNDIEQIKNYILMFVRIIIMSPTMIIIALFHTISQNAQLTLVIACAIPLILIVMLIIFYLAMPVFKSIQTKLDNLTVALRESLTGIRVVRAYNQQETEYKKFDHANKEITFTNRRAGQIMSIAYPSINIIFNLAFIFIYLIGLFLINNQIFSLESFNILSDVAVVAQYSTQVMASFLMFAMVFVMLPQASACAKRVNEVLDIKTSINDDEAKKFAVSQLNKKYRAELNDFSNKYNKITGHKFNKDYLFDLLKNKKADKNSNEYNLANEFKILNDKYEDIKNKILNKNSEEYIEIIDQYFSKRQIKGTLEFDNVTFIYPDADKPCIENISFVAKPGTVTAIIGSTGSGKSTIVNLIPRFYDVTNGSIKLDGIDIKKLPQKTLRDNLGFVPQQAVLFYGTIKDNLKFGKDDASDKEINEALQIAQAQNFVSKLPDNINTFVSQSGKNFSGGQKQRLAIARALVKKPEIYVFDDSFSALDFKTDLALRTALKSYTKESAVILVAQRVSTIINADNILVLNDGKIVGQGKHEDLLVNCPVYQDIVKSQLDPDEVEKTINLSKSKNGGNE